jgi:hypothetical protein
MNSIQYFIFRFIVKYFYYDFPLYESHIIDELLISFIFYVILLNL